MPTTVIVVGEPLNCPCCLSGSGSSSGIDLGCCPDVPLPTSITATLISFDGCICTPAGEITLTPLGGPQPGTGWDGTAGDPPCTIDLHVFCTGGRWCVTSNRLVVPSCEPFFPTSCYPFDAMITVKPGPNTGGNNPCPLGTLVYHLTGNY
jgi:hypothetical protein